jgi:biopolymer transport protein ExbD
MIRFERRVQWFSGQVDVAPSACVFFLLVIFLLLMTHLAPAPGVRIELPEARLPDPASGVDWLVVVVDREGKLYFNQQVISEESLGRELGARTSMASSPLELVLQADTALRLGQMARVFALSRRAGITNLKFQTRPADLGLPIAPVSR